GGGEVPAKAGTFLFRVPAALCPARARITENFAQARGGVVDEALLHGRQLVRYALHARSGEVLPRRAALLPVRPDPDALTPVGRQPVDAAMPEQGREVGLGFGRVEMRDVVQQVLEVQ